jgi:hypothetical protein
MDFVDPASMLEDEAGLADDADYNGYEGQQLEPFLLLFNSRLTSFSLFNHPSNLIVKYSCNQT